MFGLPCHWVKQFFNFLLLSIVVLNLRKQNFNILMDISQVAFEFRYAIHSHLSGVFFDEVVKTNVNAFLKRARKLHGPESIQRQKPKVINYVS